MKRRNDMRRIVIHASLSMLLAIMVFACEDNPENERRMGVIPTDELVQLIDSKHWTTSRFVAAVVAERGKEAIPPLLAAIEHSDENARNHVLSSTWWAIGEIEDPELPGLLTEILRSRGWQDTSGYGILAGSGSQGVEPLLEALGKATGSKRRFVIDALGRLDDPGSGQALLEIASNEDESHSHRRAAVSALVNRRSDAGYSLLELANSDPDMWKYVARMLKPAEDKRLLPFYFRQAQSKDEMVWHRGAMGIARNAGKAELPRLEKELSRWKRDWVLPFVKINCAIEDVESESEKAEILWKFILDAEYYHWSASGGRYGVYEEASLYIGLMPDPQDRPPVIYAIEKLAELGDIILPLLKEGLKSDRKEVRLRAIRALSEMPGSKASTELLLKAWDSLEWEDDEEIELGILGRIVRELGERKEKRVIPRIFKILNEAPPYSLPENTLNALDNLGDKTVIPRMIKVWEGISPKMMELRGDAHASETARVCAAGEFAEIIDHWKVTDPSVIPLLVDAMLSYRHGDGPYGGLYTQRLAAILALVRIGEPAIEALRGMAEPEEALKERRPGTPVNVELAKAALKILGQPTTPGR